MTLRETTLLRPQQQRFMRPDAVRYLRPDAARFLAPRSNPAEIYPALARKSDTERARVRQQWANEAIDERGVLDALQHELQDVRQALMWRRVLREQAVKSNPKQPRWLRGQDGAGRFKREGDSGSAASSASVMASGVTGDAGADPAATATADDGIPAVEIPETSVGDLGSAPLDGNIGSLGGRRIIIKKPNEPEGSGDEGGDGDGTGGGLGGSFGVGNLLGALGSLLGPSPADPPPDIPAQKPGVSAQVTAFLRAASSWLMRNAGLAADLYTGLLNTVDWLQYYQDTIQANRDPPMTLQELHDGVGKNRRGYENHHVKERAALAKLGLSRSEIDDPSNLVSIPRLKHYQITGWYATPTEEFGGLSPREYLSDKDANEHRRVGINALIKFKVLKP